MSLFDWRLALDSTLRNSGGRRAGMNKSSAHFGIGVQVAGQMSVGKLHTGRFVWLPHFIALQFSGWKEFMAGLRAKS